MTPFRKKSLAVDLYFAYTEAENEVEAQKIKDCAYEMGMLIGESYIETCELNRIVL